MVKDTYGILRIQDTLDCLHSAVWVTLLDLKNGFWQVEFKALTAFTVGPLRFYKCEQMSFG